ncbi:MAG: 3-methyl-2-oxobutanoate hydroxymethyltransferase [Gammaproteobacteria bacterium]|nr:3-methyl-2-oxobutanoate hydroxymethyltransferase [Gammaproteobacteria bacterium]
MRQTDHVSVTVPYLRIMKAEGRKIAALTAYDVSFAQAMDRAGIDVVLIGDSLGMVVQGHKTTLPVSLADMAYHTACVARGLERPLIIADMPFLTFQGGLEDALRAAGALMQAGAHMVKLEGAGPVLETVAYLHARGIPVCGHIGLTPQSVNAFGGFKVQGRGERGGELRVQAHKLAEAGVDALVLEAVPAMLAAEITRHVPVPTIGIGAGRDCDGQVLVMHDVLGLNTRAPRFVRDFLAHGGSIEGAFRAYVEAVRGGAFPTEAESYAS